MITDRDKRNVEAIKGFIDSFTTFDFEHPEVDWEKVSWIETLDTMIYNLTIAPDSYRDVSEQDLKDGYYTVICPCGWWGSSRLLLGGGQIADTGDYFDCTCPVCGCYDISEK